MKTMIKCQVCGKPTGLKESDLITCLPVCSQACSDKYIKAVK